MQRFTFLLVAVFLPLIGFHGTAIAQEKAEISVESHIFPTEVLKRPFTLPMGSFEARVKFDKQAFNTEDFMFKVGAAVGVTNDLELSVAWDGFNINKLTPAKSMSVGAGYFLYATHGVAAMLSLSMPLYFDGEQKDAGNRLTNTGNVFRSVSLSMPTAFSINPHMNFMAFHDDLLVIKRGSPNLWDSAGNEIVSDDADLHALINLPLKFGWQATSKLWLTAGTNFATFHLGNSKEKFINNSTFIWQKTPLYLTGLYAITNAIDVVVSAGFNNLQSPRETFTALIGFDFRGGRLNG